MPSPPTASHPKQSVPSDLLYESGKLAERWLAPGERLNWEVPWAGGRVACYDRHRRLDGVRAVLYPELIYRRFEGDILVGEVVLELVMRCYYPEAFEELIRSQGFRLVRRWGGTITRISKPRSRTRTATVALASLGVATCFS